MGVFKMLLYFLQHLCITKKILYVYLKKVVLAFLLHFGRAPQLSSLKESDSSGTVDLGEGSFD
jgi:hypothetical protein